ncbi:hypothetical protein IU427_16080 [Nocardia beijingensis]|uniref:hypothetical protein n=1 Tax=Nocardia beijingensis TaxID=95162 RepID=UPI001895814B|nr:hypothetical protein [Nocardia beijingensis]MBF6466687.1 hypothetical protein [Nocardia beijingensis]
MNYDARAEAEIDVLMDVLAALDAATRKTARGGLSDTERIRLSAVVLYELIVSARGVAGPDTGRLYAASILDPIIEGLAVADDVSLLDVLIPALLDRDDLS